MVPITGVILTHNEALNIERCIAHIRPHVAEIILIDTFSSDDTLAIAAPLVDKVLMHQNVANFDALRNLAIPEASHSWMWFVDADEFVPLRTGELVQKWIADEGDQFEAIRIPFKSYFCGQWMQHCGWWPGYTCPRVLKKGCFEFGAKLHSGVKLQGRERFAPPDPSIGIDHFSYKSLHHWVEKFNRYTSTEAQQLAAEGVQYDWRDAVRAMATDLWGHYEYHSAERDGQKGWILTVCNAFYRWMSYAKLIDCRTESVDRRLAAPASLSEFLDCLESELAFRRSRYPQAPLGVILHASIWDMSQVSADAQRSAYSISLSGRTLKIDTPQQNTGAVTLSPAEAAILRAHCQTKRPHSTVAISYRPNWVADRSACFNVFRSLDNNELLGPGALRPQGFDEIWVGDEVYRHALIEQGGEPERIRCIEPEHIPHVLGEIEASLVDSPLPEPDDRQWCIAIEGEFFSGHSFSNINEQLARLLQADRRVALTIKQVVRAPTSCSSLSSKRLRPFIARPSMRDIQATIRHMFPPDWAKPKSGRWILMQHWEFGYLPQHWVNNINDAVDDVWAVSKYVMDVFKRSGVDMSKVHYVPLGIDPTVFRPEGPKRRLPIDSAFRFLYVGGTILRKGFDRVLAAYLKEFTAEDDVCLVIKDSGSQTFYRSINMREQILRALENPRNPKIIYYEDDFSEGQLAALYRSCNCLVAPYRGEGFGLPVLEAMACGVPPIVPMGGATDDFTNVDTAYLLPSRAVAVGVDAGLDERSTELHVEVSDVAAAMRLAYRQSLQTRTMGAAASEQVRHRWTWEQTRQCMVRRLEALCISSYPGSLGPINPIDLGDDTDWPQCPTPQAIGQWLLSQGATDHVAFTGAISDSNFTDMVDEWQGTHLHLVDVLNFQMHPCDVGVAAMAHRYTTVHEYKLDAYAAGIRFSEQSLDAVVWQANLSEFELCWYWLTTWFSKVRKHGLLYIYHQGIASKETPGALMETAIQLFEQAFETSVKRRQSPQLWEWLVVVGHGYETQQQIHITNQTRAADPSSSNYQQPTIPS